MLQMLGGGTCGPALPQQRRTLGQMLPMRHRVQGYTNAVHCFACADNKLPANYRTGSKSCKSTHMKRRGRKEGAVPHPSSPAPSSEQTALAPSASIIPREETIVDSPIPSTSRVETRETRKEDKPLPQRTPRPRQAKKRTREDPDPDQADCEGSGSEVEGRRARKVKVKTLCPSSDKEKRKFGDTVSVTEGEDSSP